jgi:hypothetical protein
VPLFALSNTNPVPKVLGVQTEAPNPIPSTNKKLPQKDKTEIVPTKKPIKKKVKKIIPSKQVSTNMVNAEEHTGEVVQPNPTIQKKVNWLKRLWQLLSK